MEVMPGAGVLLLLWLAALLAGFVDSIAGGGGLITLPALLAAGLPPHFALGTNKLQSSFGSFSAAIHYRHGGLVRFRNLLPGVAFTFIGAVLGTTAVQALDPGFLRWLIPLLLVLILGWTFLRPNLGEAEGRPRLRPLPFFMASGLGIGFYDGFFGPGTGTFWTALLVGVLGMNLKSATATTKVVNFTSNVTALGAFALGGHVLLVPGLVMGTGQFLGARLGSRLVMRRHVGLVRTVFRLVVTATLLKLVWDLVG
ncbi:MAG: TSUP family transporter [bacterium]|nr:TSUP family transporter [bacterium]